MLGSDRGLERPPGLVAQLPGKSHPNLWIPWSVQPKGPRPLPDNGGGHTWFPPLPTALPAPPPLQLVIQGGPDGSALPLLLVPSLQGLVGGGEPWRLTAVRSLSSHHQHPQPQWPQAPQPQSERAPCLGPWREATNPALCPSLLGHLVNI